MILYHGSNIEVREPCLNYSKRLLDFGAAFYLTSSIEQARKWAFRTTTIRNAGKPVVSAFNFNENLMSRLNVLSFSAPTREWLHFVADNRTGKTTLSYDLVIGPVANDQAIRTVTDFMMGYFDEEIAVQILRPQKLKDQYAFKTENALNLLHFREVLS